MDITVGLLIYRSTDYLDFVMRSLISTHSKKHNVRYIIVCNDATPEVIDRAEWWTEHPKDDPIQIDCVIHTNPDPNEWWIQRVYRAWNKLLAECKTPYLCAVNSDLYFSPNWLDNLAKYDTLKCIPTSKLVESGRMQSLPGLISKNFGQTLAEFDSKAFLEFAEEIKQPTWEVDIGAYGPLLVNTELFRKAGGWHSNHNGVPGDKITFHILKRNFGLRHIMVNDSIAYHFIRGESFETGDLQ